MPRKLIWGLVVSLGAVAPTTSAWAACNEQGVVLKPGSSTPAAKDFKAWLAKQKDADAPGDDDLYVVDLNNDGKDEFVVTTLQGSAGFLQLDVYARSPDGAFRLLEDAPPAPGGKPVEGGWYQFLYMDPVTKNPAPFTRLCGKTYMSFPGANGFGSRDSYLWDSKGTHPACDAPWTAYIRADFKKAYDHKDYDLADKRLAGFATQCARALDDDTRAWIANDLAITQYHLGEPQRCLEYATQAKANPKVRSAALYNEGLCKKASTNLSSDFTWLLDKSLTNTNQLVWAEPFKTTLRAIVPNLKQGEPEGLRKAVADGLGGPPDDKQVDAERYVTASACMAHACDSKAMMWVDVKERIGLVALNNASDLGVADTCDLAIGSRIVGPKAIPTPFWEAFKRWRTQIGDEDTKRPGACVSFIAPDGTVSRVTPP